MRIVSLAVSRIWLTALSKLPVLAAKAGAAEKRPQASADAPAAMRFLLSRAYFSPICSRPATPVQLPCKRYLLVKPYGV